MTRATRRVTTLLLAALAAALLSLALAAGPALATEGEESAEHVAEEATGFGSGQWDGMLLAGAAGILMGLIVFSQSDPGSIAKADAHH